MAEIGHVMNKKIIAEFVENDLILEALREMGIDFYQGFRASPPLPILQKT